MNKDERNKIINGTHEIFDNKKATIYQRLKIFSEFLDSCTIEEFMQQCENIKLRNKKGE